MKNLMVKDLCNVIEEGTRVLVFKNRQLLVDDCYKNVTKSIFEQPIQNIEFDHRNECIVISLINNFVYDKRFQDKEINSIVNNTYNDVEDMDKKQYFKNCLQHRLEIDFTFARGVEIVLSEAKIQHEYDISDIDTFLHRVAIATPGTRIVISQNFDGIYGYTIDSEGSVNY